MTMLPRFASPAMLILLIVVPWSIYVGMKIRSLPRGRKWTAIVLRSLILLALVFALAGTEIVKQSDRLAVFFLLDQSNSIPEELRTASAQWVRNMCDNHMTLRDEAGVIVFGDDASIELAVDPKLGLREVRSYVGGEQTDLAAALRLAMAAFPQGYMRRIVALSDGNETRGSGLEEAKLARADGTAVDVLPLTTGGTQEVRMREVSAPGQTKADEPFQLRIVVHAEQDCAGKLQVYQRVGGTRRMLRPQEVQLQRGDNVFLLTQELGRSGFYEYEVMLETDADTITANNIGRAFTRVHGEPKVLYVEADPSSSYLEPALKGEGLNVTRIVPQSMPTSLALLQNYDGVILSNVSCTDLTTDQLHILEAMVRDLGIGLVMVGGPESFGAGGYLDTPVEKALPVDMDIKQRKVLPRGALAVVMHTCEIPSGNVWARKIALAALNVLSSQDLMGALGYLHSEGGDSWIFELQPVGDKTKLQYAITKGSSQIGDMPSTDGTLVMAYKGLSEADAAVKRAVLISDGDPAAPLPATINKFVKANIAISTVCINPHSPNDQNMLRNVAYATGGQYYYVTNPNNLPQIFTKEAAVVKRGVMIEAEFVPQALHDSELLLGLAQSPLPALHGYVVTTPKENATIPLVSHEGDPVLAHWRYGLGKSVAFTSDVTSRWAVDWLGWEGFNRFWAQSVRWALREVAPTSLRVDTSLKDGQGYVRIDAVDEQGNFINFLRPKGVVTSPDFDRLELDLAQTGPGIYEGTFPVGDSGVYMVNLTYQNEDGAAGMIPTGLAVAYSPEYEHYTPNLALLENVALAGGGRMLGTEDNPFQHDLVASPTITPIWHYLVIFAACLLPVEIFVRRVVVPLALVVEVLARWLRKLPGLGRFVPAPSLRSVPATGTYATKAAREHDFGTAEGAPESFGEVRAATEAGESPEEYASEAGTDRDATRPVGHSAYTQRLLAAKDRAFKGKGVKGRVDEDKENE